MVVEAGMANTKGWKDATSYSRGERDEKIAPRTYEMSVGKLRLVVTRHIHYDPTDWVLRMEGVFETTLRGDKTAEFAMHNCMMLARDYLRKALDEVTKELDAAIAKGVDNMLADPKAAKKSE
jgi:hypothetical protein